MEHEPDTLYVATSTGGAWKTTNRGVTWEPIFQQGGTASLGSVALAALNRRSNMQFALRVSLQRVSDDAEE